MTSSIELLLVEISLSKIDVVKLIPLNEAGFIFGSKVSSERVKKAYVLSTPSERSRGRGHGKTSDGQIEEQCEGATRARLDHKLDSDTDMIGLMRSKSTMRLDKITVRVMELSV